MSNMKDGTYNGWTNYATWRVNLEIFDGMDVEDMGWHRMDKFELAPMLKEYVEEILEGEIGSKGEASLALSYALAFVEDVNYREIAKHMLEDYAD